MDNSDFFSDILGYNKLELGKNPTVASSAKESNGLSYMGRINYRLMDRYLLTLLARRDGYSAFGKEMGDVSFYRCGMDSFGGSFYEKNKLVE